MNNDETQSSEKINDTILGTKTASMKSECENTTPKWERECPRCHKILGYSNKYKLQRAIESNSQCARCCNAIVLTQDVYKRECPKCGRNIEYRDKESFYTARRCHHVCKPCSSIGKNVGRHPSEMTRKKMSAAHVGVKHTSAHRKRITGNGNPMYGVHRYDKSNPFFGKRHREEARRKMRVAACKRVLTLHRSNNGRVNNVGKGETQYFDQLERERGWFGNRQHFVSHLGYFVDYYEPNHNIVVEYDEPRHYRHGHLREKDRVRMEQIREHLKCEFWRYDAYRKQLVEF